MKKLFIIPAIALAGLMYNKADAQIGISANIGPVAVSYSQDAANVPDVVYTADGQQIAIDGDDFYYMPDVGAYYDVNDQSYIYFNGYNWIVSEYLPGAYADFNWNTCRRFEIRGYNPFFHDGFYRERYAGVRIADWNYRNGRYFDHDAYYPRDFSHRGDYNRDFDRRDDHSFDRRDDHGFDRRDDHGFDRRDDHGFDRRDDRGFNQVQVNRGFGRPAPYTPQGGGQFENRQNFQNNNRGFNQPVEARTFNRPAEPFHPQGGQFENRAENRPAFQNNNRGAENFGRGRQDGRFNGR